ncbi:MAG TPA: amino acid ABC transporter ATP-binding protein [Acholeplasma sp.]|nr:amino acid ABC transporter ATP-binding protein [Acholeplasma sp.]
MPNDLLFEIKNLNKVFDDGTIALKDVDLTIKKNKVTVIIGPSGSGKSTLLRTLNLMEIPTSGEIKIHGNDILSSDFDIHNHRKLVGMVFQNFNLFSHLSIIDNLNLAQIQVLKRNKLDATNRSLALLDKVGLLSKKDNHPNQLSGGQQQRIAILRALLMDPEVILFDEPTSALDPEMIKEVLLLMKDLMTTGITMVIVTHEMNFARAFADQMVVMGKGGKIIETGTPKMIFEQAKHDKTKQFLSNVLNSF